VAILGAEFEGECSAAHRRIAQLAKQQTCCEAPLVMRSAPAVAGGFPALC